MGDLFYQGKERYKNPEVATKYDDKRFSNYKGRWTDKREKECIEKALEIAQSSGPALDLPCGTGRMTELLLEKGFDVTGGDISQEMMNFAEKRTAKFGDRVRYEICDIENLQFESESFDIILTIRLLHHIPQALHPKILSELHRVAKKWVIITYSEKFSFQNIRRDFWAIFTKFPRYAISGSKFDNEVKDAGFKIVKKISMFPIVSESIFVLLEKLDN